MSKEKETKDTNIDAENSNDRAEAKVDLEKVREYEGQVIESVESASSNDVNLSKEDGNSVDLSKEDTQTDNQHYQQSYQQQQYQQSNYQQQYNNNQYVNQQYQQQQYQQQQYQQQQYQQQQYQQQPYQQQQYQQAYQQNVGVVTPDKLALEPTLACLVSVLVIGLGQMLNGQIEKGLLLLFGGMFAVIAIAFITCGFGAVLSPLLIVVSALDAYNCAKRLQMGQSIGKYEFHIFG